MLLKLAKRRGVSPLISSLLIMVTTMLALSITLGYTQSTLTRKNGETDFESAKSFMKNLGLQVDDVAWVKGRVDTVHFTSQYGQIEYLPGALTYTIEFYDKSGTFIDRNVTSGDIFMYNMPVDKYYLEEGYYQPVINEGSENLVLRGAKAPVTRVFAAQSTTVGDAEYLRVVLVPAIRYQAYNMTVMSGDPPTPTTARYVRLYLPKLQPGYSSDMPKSIVLTGVDIGTEIHRGVGRIDVTLEFPLSDSFYDNDFFRFTAGTTVVEQGPLRVKQTITLTNEANVELYVGLVKLDYGS